MQILKWLIERYLAECQLLINPSSYFEFSILNSRALQEMYVRNNVLTSVYKDGVLALVSARLYQPGRTLVPECWAQNQLTNLDVVPGLDLDLTEHPFWHRTSNERLADRKQHFHIGHTDRTPITVNDIKCLSLMWRKVDTNGLGKCRDAKSDCILTDEVTENLLQSYKTYIDKNLDEHNFYTCRQKLYSDFYSIFFMSLMNNVILTFVKCYAHKSALSDPALHFLSIMSRVLTLVYFGISLEAIANQISIEQTLQLFLKLIKLDSNHAINLLMTVLCYQNDYLNLEKLAINLAASTLGGLSATPLEYFLGYLAKPVIEENNQAIKPTLTRTQ